LVPVQAGFSYYCIKTICEQLESLIEKIFKYACDSDFYHHNIAYREKHPALKPFVDGRAYLISPYMIWKRMPPIQLLKKYALDQKALQNL